MSAHVYQAQVLSTLDPLGLGRAKVVIPQISGPALSAWAEPSVRTYGPAPVAGAAVWVSLDTGDPGKPVYFTGPTYSPWTAMPAAWMAASFSAGSAAYRTGPGGAVAWRGAITTTTSPTFDAQALFTLPAALAPASNGPSADLAVLAYPASAPAVVTGLKLSTTGAATLRGAAISFTGTLTLCLALSYTTI